MTEEWGVAWAWVAGYSAISTLVIIFNIVIVFSVLSNRYLHYSYNYVMVMLSLRYSLRRRRSIYNLPPIEIFCVVC